MSNPSSTLQQLLSASIGSRPVDCNLASVSAVEWNEVVNLAFAQGVNAVAADGYNRMFAEGSSDGCAFEIDESLDNLKYEWFLSVLQAEEDYRHFAEVVCSLAGIFAEKGLKMMVMKGYGLSQDYPIPAHRTLGDIDIFLSDGTTPVDGLNPAAVKGDKILRSLGFKVNNYNPHHSEFKYDGITIENHHFILDNDSHSSNAKIERRLRALLLWNNAIDVNGVNVYLPSATFCALHLLRHSGGHFCTTGIHLRHVMDWGMFIKAHHDEIDWPELIRSAQEFCIIKWMGCLNAICVDYLGLDASLFSPVESDKALVARILNDIFYPEFQGDIPSMTHIFSYGLAKTRKMIVNRWKYPLVYEEGLLRSFWSLAKNRLRRLSKYAE